jgi:hypothetical protein
MAAKAAEWKLDGAAQVKELEAIGLADAVMERPEGSMNR